MANILVGIGVADAPGSFVTRALEQVQLTFEGIAHDRHAGLTMKAGVRQPHFPRGVVVRNTRQLSVVSVEELAEVAHALGLPSVDYRLLGANLCVEGIEHLSQLPGSTRLQFASGATVVVDCENAPCKNPGKALVAEHGAPAELAAQFVKAAMGKRGVVGWVEREGLIRRGDEVRVVSP